MSENTLQTTQGPPTLNHVIGQKAVIEQARIAMDAAFQDGQPFPSALMTGPPGLGKSMIAQVIAREMASGYSEILGQTLMCPVDLNAILLGAAEKSVLFIDEADELPIFLMTALYRAVEDRRVYLESSSVCKTPRTIPLPPFTIILASNHEHSIVPQLRDRLRLHLRFEYYTEAELADVLRQRSRSLKWAVDEQVVALIAQRGRGTPRIALRLLESCRRVCRSLGETIILPEHLDKACSLEGVDTRGLDRQELTLLRMLHESKRPLRLNVIAARLGLPPKSISNVFEPYLLRLGLIQRCAEGRTITQEGIEYLTATASEALETS
jgi:Holliday junction DNA helicase RuvB